MKKINFIFLLLLLAGISIVAEIMNDYLVERPIDQTINNSIKRNSNVRTYYNFDVEYVANRNSFSVNEIIKWKNTSNTLVDTFYFNLPKSAQENIDDLSYLKYKINSFNIDGKPVEFSLINNFGKNFLDSTLALVQLDVGIEQNQEVVFEINYNIFFHDSQKFYEGHFYNFENWYVSVLPFLGGKHYSYPLHKFIEPFLEYSDYIMNLTIPVEFDIAASGIVERNLENTSEIIKCSAKGINNFSWFAFNKLSKYKKRINISNRDLDVVLFIKESKDGYADRYFDVAEKYLQSLSKFSVYPFQNLIIVDLPNVANLKSKSSPNLISLKSDLISPIRTQKIEYKLATLIAEQYFGNILASNNMVESWLSKGLSAFVGEKLVREHYGELFSYFNVADYYPIYGLHFMSYAGIPLIYTIGEHVIPEGARYINSYYDNLAFADLSIPTYKLPSYDAYKVSSIVKPQVALLTLEKFLGKKKFNANLTNYFRRNLFQYPTSEVFIEIMRKNCSTENKELFIELFKSDKIFDYGISYIEQREDNQYDIMVERIGSGVTPIKLSVHREIDTLQINWDGKDKFKIFTINSNFEIISAEIDADNKNLLDLNFANNSYVIEEQYWGSISYATRVFFWFQNALMLIGGKG